MDRTVVNPKVMVGKPVIRGIRVAVYEIVKDIRAALAYAGQLMEGEDIFFRNIRIRELKKD